MNRSLWPGRAHWTMLLGVLILISATKAAGSTVTCTGTSCPGAHAGGSSPEAPAPPIVLTFILNENEAGPPVPLFLGDKVFAGDVQIFEGGSLSDLLRFPEDLTGGRSDNAVLYSADDPGGIPSDRSTLRLISIFEDPTGAPTTYIAKNAGVTINYNIVSPEALDTPEPGTAVLLGVTGLALMIGLRVKTA